jgi:hypothetical protein
MTPVQEIKLVIDNNALSRYEEYYFSIHKKATKKPIAQPYHESINVWMIMKRPMMNSLKGKWKDFIVWMVKDQGYDNLHIDKCDLIFDTFYATYRRHDVDNSCPKFIIDGLCDGGLLIDDSSDHVTSLLLRCFVDHDNPRTEITIRVNENKYQE